jgi:hypothetical protein
MKNKEAATTSKSLFQKAQNKIKHGLVLNFFFDKLADWGFFIEPYYVFSEGLFGKPINGLSEGFETTFLNADDMKQLDQIEGREETEEALRDRLKRGNKCFGLKRDNKIVGFTWCDLDHFNHRSKFKFKLKENEAYLFDAYILKSYRGHNLAPMMRYQCYQNLENLGRNVFYSVSYCFNTPAVRFKKKLNARIDSLCLYVRLAKKWDWHWRLRRYGS